MCGLLEEVIHYKGRIVNSRTPVALLVGRGGGCNVNCGYKHTLDEIISSNKHEIPANLRAIRLLHNSCLELHVVGNMWLNLT